MTQRASTLGAVPSAGALAERPRAGAQAAGAADRRGVTDTLSDVLRAVRLTGAVFFAIDASNPG